MRDVLVVYDNVNNRSRATYHVQGDISVKDGGRKDYPRASQSCRALSVVTGKKEV